MFKKFLNLFLACTIVCGTFSCKKGTDFPDKETTSSAGASTRSLARISTTTDEAASADFSASVTENVENSVSDLFSDEYQATEEFADLADASAAILQRAGLLNAYMDELNITNYYDPRLIMAAKIINDLYVEGPPPIDNINSANLWQCLLSTLGVPATAVVDVMRGMTMAEIGTLVEAMGSRWLIKQLAKIGLEAVTGWGAAIVIAEFTMCMVFNDEFDGIVDEPQFQFPPNVSRTYTAVDFYTYIVSAVHWEMDRNPGNDSPVWDKFTIESACNAFKTNPNAAYAGYYLGYEPGFMDKLSTFINAPDFEIPEF